MRCQGQWKAIHSIGPCCLNGLPSHKRRTCKISNPSPVHINLCIPTLNRFKKKTKNNSFLFKKTMYRVYSDWWMMTKCRRFVSPPCSSCNDSLRLPLLVSTVSPPTLFYVSLSVVRLVINDGNYFVKNPCFYFQISFFNFSSVCCV